MTAVTPLNEQNVALDETMEMVCDNRGEAKGLVPVTLQRLQAYDLEIAAFREEFKRLSQPGAGIADLQQIVEGAVRLQAQMNIPQEMLTRDTLMKAGIPVEELEQARSVLQCVAAHDRAQREVQNHLEVHHLDAASADSLARCLETHRDLRLLSNKLQQQQGKSRVASIDLQLSRRQATTAQLSQALLEKAATCSPAQSKDVVGKLQHFHSQDHIKQELVMLSVRVPSFDVHGGRTQTLDARVVPRDAPQGGGGLADVAASQPFAAHGKSPAMHSLEGPAFGQSSSSSHPAERSHATERTGHFGSSSPSNTFDNPMFTFTGLEAPPTAIAGVDVNHDGRADFYYMGADRNRDGIPDALQNTDSAVPSKPSTGASEWPSMSPAVASRDNGSAYQKGRGGPQHTPAAPRHGSPDLWQAVHVGDENHIVNLIQHGACDGQMMDASGHTVLWHAIAFNHFGIARRMIERFPPGHELGVDFAEVHPRRGDTLLHLLCQCRPFEAETAHLFTQIANSVAATHIERANAQGLTFLHIACSMLNFWVLKFTFLHHPASTKAIVCSQSAPLRAIAEMIPQPVPPSFTPPDRIPEHFPLAHLLGSSGRVPFADVAFDVGSEDPSSKAERGRFLAHRVVVAAQSSTLLEELERLEIQELPKEGVRAVIFKVDHRISKEVWRSALQFLYTGVIACPFERDVQKMVELFRACAMYKLPTPLLDYTQSLLFHLLPTCGPHMALQVFSLAAGSSGEDIDVRLLREAATYILLRSAQQVFESLEPMEVAKILERMLQTVETQVFNPMPKPAPKGILKQPSNFGSEEAMYQQQQQQAAVQQQMSMQQGVRQMYDPSMQQVHHMHAAQGGYMTEAQRAAMYGGMQGAGNWASGNWR